MARGENQEAQTGNVPAASTAAAGPKPASAGTGKGAEGQSVVRRLQSELMALMMGGDPGVSAFPEGDNIFNWVGTIAGSAGTAYEGTSYRLALAFTAEYPYKPPKVRFDTPCFHPNVDVHGNICLDILQDKWSSAYDVRTILLSIQSLLGGNESQLIARSIPCIGRSIDRSPDLTCAVAFSFLTDGLVDLLLVQSRTTIHRSTRRRRLSGPTRKVRNSKSHFGSRQGSLDPSISLSE